MNDKIISLQDRQRQAAADQARKEALNEIRPLYTAMREMDAADLATFCRALERATDYIITARHYEYFASAEKLAGFIAGHYMDLKVSTAEHAATILKEQEPKKRQTL